MKNNVMWFPKEPIKNTLELHIDEEGILSFNDAATETLCEYVLLGFNCETKQIYLKNSSKQKGYSIRSFPRKITALTNYLIENHVSFPITYQLNAPNRKKYFWEGTDLRKHHLNDLEFKIFEMMIEGYEPLEIQRIHSISKEQYKYVTTKILSLFYK